LPAWDKHRAVPGERALHVNNKREFVAAHQHVAANQPPGVHMVVLSPDCGGFLPASTNSKDAPPLEALLNTTRHAAGGTGSRSYMHCAHSPGQAKWVGLHCSFVGFSTPDRDIRQIKKAMGGLFKLPSRANTQQGTQFSVVAEDDAVDEFAAGLHTANRELYDTLRHELHAGDHVTVCAGEHSGESAVVVTHDTAQDAVEVDLAAGERLALAHENILPR
jgi:hypothetical protein